MDIGEYGGLWGEMGGIGGYMGRVWGDMGHYGGYVGLCWRHGGSVVPLPPNPASSPPWTHEVAEMHDGGGPGAGGGGAGGGSHRVVDGHRDAAPLLRHRAAPCGNSATVRRSAGIAATAPPQRHRQAVLQHRTPNPVTAPPLGRH